MLISKFTRYILPHVCNFLVGIRELSKYNIGLPVIYIKYKSTLQS